jgi:hypothetical protein
MSKYREVKMTIYRKLDNKNIAALESILPIARKPKVRLITRIQIPKDFVGKGVESELLDIICELADKEQMKLYFSVAQYRKGQRFEIVDIMIQHKFKLCDSLIMYRLYAGCKDSYIDAEIDEILQFLQGDD